MPFLRTLLVHADALYDGMSCPTPGVDIDAIVPAAGTVATPVHRDAHIPVDVVSGFHGSAVDAADVPSVVTRLLRNGRIPTTGGWNVFDGALRATAAAWRVPRLALNDNGPWRTPAVRSHETGCALADAGFARWAQSRGGMNR